MTPRASAAVRVQSPKESWLPAARAPRCPNAIIAAPPLIAMWRTALFLLYAAAAAQDYDPSEAGGRARMYALLDAMVTAALSDDRAL